MSDQLALGKRLRVLIGIALLFFSVIARCQELKIFDFSFHDYDGEAIPFVSLSDILPYSETPDTLLIPDLSYHDEENATDFEYLQLQGKNREHLLALTGLSESDHVFIYDYSRNNLKSFLVKELKLIACLNFYGADWPYRDADYMIGFEFDRNKLVGYHPYYAYTLISLGKENPFENIGLHRIVWDTVRNEIFPGKSANPKTLEYFSGNTFRIEHTYFCEADGLKFYARELRMNEWAAALELIVIDPKTNTTILEKVYYDGEAADLASPDEQWTGRLFKGKPSVVFGFQWFTFGCPSISFIDPVERDLEINCDNRH